MNVQPKDNVPKNDYDRLEEQVDPRVQIELERLNAATDDINKLEVDLDEARAGFRQLLCESTVRLENLGKKLGSCVEKARPYYEARIKSKEALLETQKAALRFERANSSHAAAKEMVYLAEEGLTAEGRTFDHAWQEMLNHATMRVNESELERTLSEAHHKRTSLIYHATETKVQQLQKDLKRSIAKSRAYFEAKAQFNKLLEEQKLRVKALEKKVSAAKSNYAEALRNLEHISDEMHRMRKSMDPLGVSSLATLGSPDATTPSTSTNQETDRWTDTTGSPDSDIGDEYLQLPDKLSAPSLPYVRFESHRGRSYKKLENRSADTSPGCDVQREEEEEEEEEDEEEKGGKGGATGGESGGEWSEIRLSPVESPPGGGVGVTSRSRSSGHHSASASARESARRERLATWIARVDTGPRRQSLDVISNSLATNVKEILSQGIMKLNISSLTERRGSEPRLVKKAPSPLDKTMPYLNTEDDSASDTESLASVEMLSDDQISSLMLDQEIQEAYNDLLASPLP